MKLSDDAIKVGSLVVSTAGRDSTRIFIVVELVSDGYVKIADGRLRKTDKPKLKKTKHLLLLQTEAATLADMENNGAVRRYIDRALSEVS